MNSRPSKKIAPQPLTGLRVLVGRARHQAGALSGGLRALGAQVIEIPFIEIRKPRSYRPLDSALKNLKSYDWLILTSVNGVEAMWERMRRLHLNRRHLAHLQIAAIGPATKKAIEKRGVKVNVVPEEYVAESVVASLRSKVKGKRILLARARVARDVIPRELRKLADHLDVVEAYETVVPAASRARVRAILSNPRRHPHVITFTSSSTVRNFAALAGTKFATAVCAKKADRKNAGPASRPKLASIGPVTSATLRELGFPVDAQADPYTIPGLIQAIARLR